MFRKIIKKDKIQLLEVKSLCNQKNNKWIDKYEIIVQINRDIIKRITHDLQNIQIIEAVQEVFPPKIYNYTRFLSLYTFGEN